VQVFSDPAFEAFEYVPASHFMQPMAPVFALYVPETQLKQVVLVEAPTEAE
jgi:hypothetical protein